ncbi:putative holin-like toxin [Streptococcus chenjunshii]|uniref:Holin-like toxin n=1 Tax=Streptococcus chenjunshii TaxID=2173853 RepID=A0A372KL70_9STRE|nr:putative holin-like toxin [Streptococcus chenjunshii]RFU50508.1 putative holin-like toxin [Streptococcus chenjunshii]RFU52736.1 putative holin-like toxin [Streptococcus chenjunshii]
MNPQKVKTVAAFIFRKVVVLMSISTKIWIERSSKLTIYEALQLMLTFGSLMVALVGLVVCLINFHNKK